MSEAAVAGYCRACGKALAENEIHHSHGAYYCKEHAPLETGGASPYNGSSTVYPMPPPQAGGAGISPIAAFWLGLIPGVGAIYNGQYAKGFVHVAIVGLGISILNNDAAGGFEPLVGLMLAAFWAYMPFEAYQTAKSKALAAAAAAPAGTAGAAPAGMVVPRGATHRETIGPILLIVIGTLVLLDQWNLVNLDRVLDFWPLGLIALGFWLLVKRQET